MPKLELILLVILSCLIVAASQADVPDIYDDLSLNNAFRGGPVVGGGSGGGGGGGGGDASTVRQSSSSSAPPGSNDAVAQQSLSFLERALISTDPKDEPLREAARKMLIARMNRAAEGYTDGADALRMTNYLGYGVCFTAHIVLAIGLWMAIREFRAAEKLRAATATRRKSPDSEATTTEITFAANELAIKTALHGILLLVFAAAFYFMYVKFVMPVQFVGG